MRNNDLPRDSAREGRGWGVLPVQWPLTRSIFLQLQMFTGCTLGTNAPVLNALMRRRGSDFLPLVMPVNEKFIALHK